MHAEQTLPGGTYFRYFRYATACGGLPQRSRYLRLAPTEILA